jgi:type IV pilus assembly protein PilB
MADMGVDPFMIATSVLLVSAQRLCRKLCPECKEEMDPLPPERLLSLSFTEAEANSKPKLYKAKGCPRCNNGFKGRFAVLETLPATEDIRQAIIKGKSAIDIKNLALQQGMITLRRCGLLNVLRGKTSLDEVVSVTLAD